MLNEKQEYQLYLTQDYGNLFRNDNIINGLNGIRPILTVLARGFIDLCMQEGVTDIGEQTALCQSFLTCWLNEDYTQPHNLPQRLQEEFAAASDCSLRKHIVCHSLKKKKADVCTEETVSEALSDKIDMWKKSMFFSAAKDSVNAIYFTAIIADALHKGPLTDKRLILKADADNYGIVCTKEAAEHLRQLIAVVAMCLQNLPADQVSSVTKVAQLSNYLNIAPNPQTKRSSHYSCVTGYVENDRFTYRGEPIVSKQEVIPGVVKMVLNSRWLKDYDVHLANRDAIIPPTYTVYDDYSLLPGRFPALNKSRILDDEMVR